MTPTLIEVINKVLDERAQLCHNVVSVRVVIITGNRTSDVQLPELVGWKKLSVEAISFASESSALHPARYVFVFRGLPFPKGEDK